MFPDFRIITFRSPRASLAKAMCRFHESLGGADLLPPCVMRCTPTSWCTGSRKKHWHAPAILSAYDSGHVMDDFSPIYRFDATIRYPHPVWPPCGRRASHRPCVWNMQLCLSTASVCKAFVTPHWFPALPSPRHRHLPPCQEKGLRGVNSPVPRKVCRPGWPKR